MGQIIEVLRQIGDAAVPRLGFWGIVDIVIVAVIVYSFLSLFRGTTAFSVLYGIAFLLIALAIVSSMPQLVVLNWLLRNTLPVLSVALLIVFQPELRRAMERIGRFRRLINRPLSPQELHGVSRAIEEIARACRRLSERRQGALIVLERETGLQEYADTGVTMSAVISTDLLLTLFYPGSPMHDGAVIVRGDLVAAAGCFLPLTSSSLDAQLGTRHRAAIGITELTDAVCVVVSEETGTISVANNGRLVRNLDESKLRKVLTVLYGSGAHDSFLNWPRWPGGSQIARAWGFRSAQVARRDGKATPVRGPREGAAAIDESRRPMT
jgi:diadenylate cyclase